MIGARDVVPEVGFHVVEGEAVGHINFTKFKQ